MLKKYSLESRAKGLCLTSKKSIPDFGESHGVKLPLLSSERVVLKVENTKQKERSPETICSSPWCSWGKCTFVPKRVQILLMIVTEIFTAAHCFRGFAFTPTL